MNNHSLVADKRKSHLFSVQLMQLFDDLYVELCAVHLLGHILPYHKMPAAECM